MFDGGFYDPAKGLLVRRNNLPHWRQECGLYFVTFRLADSLPQETLRAWLAEREEWERAHPNPTDRELLVYQLRCQRRLDRWLDRGLGSCVLELPGAREIVESALRFFDGDRYTLGEYAVAPNHVHALVQTAIDVDLSDVLFSWKLKTARDILALGAVKQVWSTPGHLWQHESFDHIVRNPASLERITVYIQRHETWRHFPKCLGQEQESRALRQARELEERDLGKSLHEHWGFSTFRPLQKEAVDAALDGRDSLVVMPTGGGKSLCYQLPPLVRRDLTVVVSPLISLMKDQVDSLRALGINASQIDSTSSPADKRAVHDAAMNGDLRLLFVSPERLAMERFLLFLEKVDVARFAIDEAHCISHWGHDFRPEYRQLRALRERFPGVSFHAFTATATGRVRDDIALQLELHEPEILVGEFDRPNLVYRILPRLDLFRQVKDVVDRHPGDGGIVYCIRRKDVDELTEKLVSAGVNARAYHAGMTSEERTAAQDAFSRESCDVIVATVAFGMGIDRSNVRYVVHAALPKSIEHYQQETGRAGRDGLEAECVLFYSGADALLWKSIFQKSAEEADVAAEVVAATNRQLDEMDRFARGAVCRHRALVEYFGQSLSDGSCDACDLCLGETEPVPDSTVIAQKILSGVARTGQRFGAGYVVDVLRGSEVERIRQNRHDTLSVWGLLKDVPAAVLRDWVWQLIGQGALGQSDGEYPVLVLTDESREVMRGEREVRLVQMARPKKKDRRRRGGSAAAELSGVDQTLFEQLRTLRRAIAAELGVPAYVVFGDRTLRDLAARRPSNVDEMRDIHGVGEAKLERFGRRFLDAIARFS